ncbi:hypothetical protein ADL07_33790 [Streptomyces sp. NRRL F-4707]|nr:hypothetical protein ADL07_33790 [Streptomyces sp. NRRL F-4707]
MRRGRSTAPPGALLGLGDVSAGLATEADLPADVPLGGTTAAPLAGNEPTVRYEATVLVAALNEWM